MESQTLEAPLISLISASDRISISHTELLRKCQEESLPVYFSPPSSLNIWALKTLSDDPVYSLWARVSDIPSQTLYTRSPLRKRYIDVGLPPTVLHTSCYFKLKDAEITGLLQKGSIKTSGFTQLYQLDGRNMKPGGTALPSDKELALFEKVRSETKRAKKLTPLSIGYKQEFYGLAPTEIKPAEPRDLPEIAISYEDLWIERDQFSQIIDKCAPSNDNIILEIFPELKDALDADSCQNQLPLKLTAVLSACIRAWKRCQPDLPLRSEAEWVKKTLGQQPEIKFGKETLDKICTLYTSDFDYTQGDQSHRVLPDPSRSGSRLIKSAKSPLSEEIRKSGLLVLVDAWIQHYQEADLWDDSNKKPDNKKYKVVEERAKALLESYLSDKLARHMLLILKETRPWQD